jgi:hypothetical protein
MKMFGLPVWGMFVVSVILGAVQSRPDFSGHWVLVPAKSGRTSPNGELSTSSAAAGETMRVMGGGNLLELKVTQRATDLTIESVNSSGTRKFVYTFDGKENVNVNGRATLRTTSRWVGAELVTEGTQAVATETGDIISTVREVRALDTGGELVARMVRTVEGNTNHSKQVFARNK